MEEKKYVCRYCNKEYPCGKSLGGHMKTHLMMTNEHLMMMNSNGNGDDDSVVDDKFGGGRKKWKRDFVGCEDEAENRTLSCGLRENPKKTTRFVFVHDNNNSNNNNSNVVVRKQEEEERFCKECGKGFLSLKALCGHMACHSEKDKGKKKKKVVRKLVMDDCQSDSDDDDTSSAQNCHSRRSRTMKFKTLNTDSENIQPTFGNGSSSLSDDEEDEEIATYLILLSQGYNHFDSPNESSDNNSAVVEAKSPTLGKIFSIKDAKKRKRSVSDGFEMKVEQDHSNYSGLKLKSAETVDSDDSDSGYFRNGPKKLGFSIDGKLKAPKVEVRSECEFDQRYDTELRKKMDRGNSRGTNEPRKLLWDYKRTDGLSRQTYDSVGVSCKSTPNGFHNVQPLKKPESLESETIVSDYQDSADETNESCTDTDAHAAPRTHSSSKVIKGKKNGKQKKKMKSKKSREHECPICYKKFKSGQALGGHKRSHFIGGAEENNTVVIQQAPPVVPFMIDLNLPPIDD